MVETLLVDRLTEFGDALLAALDNAKFPLSTAFWLKEEGDWTLVVGTPLYDKGPQQAYVQLIDALRTEPISLQNLPVRLEGNRSPMTKDLRRIFAKTASVRGTRLGGHSIGGKWVESAYLLRVR